MKTRDERQDEVVALIGSKCHLSKRINKLTYKSGQFSWGTLFFFSWNEPINYVNLMKLDEANSDWFIFECENRN